MPLDSSTRILAIRHGETAWNRDTRIQGHLDILLNESGLAQASRLTEALQSEALDAVYCSDLARARQTAQGLAAGAGLPLHEETGLRERSFGIFEGMTWQEIALRWPEQCLRWRQRDAEFGAEGGETLAAFYARCIGTIERIAAAHPGKTVVIVAHGGVMDCLYRAATRLALDAPRSWTLGNAAINRLLYSPEGFSLIGWNDDAHLQGLSLDEIESA